MAYSENMKQLGKKLKVALLFGGKSVEHEISLRSARNIAKAIDAKKYNLVYIGIDKNGKQGNATSVIAVDVVFPVLHGPYGEDGTIQGLLKLAGIPFVGCSVLGSAVGFDKDVAKRLLRDAGIPNSKFLTAYAGDAVSFAQAKKVLGVPVFIKPANSGSSVGVSKACSKKEFDFAIKEAFSFDTKILIEEFIDGREVECAVLGNEIPMTSVVGEITTTHSFYSYEAKYLDANGSAMNIPADLPKPLQKKIQKIAALTYRVLSCEGLTRVDCFVKKDGAIIVNEINTMPGFTDASMYPLLWQSTGVSYAKLIDRLIDLALERFAKEQKLQTSYID